jgi:acyl-coenzyme A thioesterase PaaI-like protein
VVKFVGTAKLSIDELSAERAVVSVKNRRIVQNHIGGVHAAAMALIAETATGFVVGMNVPDDRVPVIKSLKVEYKKRASGGLRAVATLTPEQIERMRTTEKGEVSVSVLVTDDAGIEPIVCEMIWAWTPKRR